jgi:enoyl-CoA hydratase/carnithine racemase
MTGTVKRDIDDRIVTLELHNPDKRNALTPDMIVAIREELADLEGRDDVRVVVLTGSGDDSFCSGFDIAGFSDEPIESVESSFRKTMARLTDSEYPVVARINGDVVGGGFELACACDLRVATDEARFGITPAKLGILYSSEGIQRFYDLLGPTYTKEFLFTADLVSADRAARMGLLNRVVAHDELDAETDDFAGTIASNAPLAVSGMKEIVNMLAPTGDLTPEQRGRADKLQQEAYESDDHEEAKQAFTEGRDPEFEGR